MMRNTHTNFLIRNKMTLFLLLAGFLISGNVFSQGGRTITGTITSVDDNMPLPGVNIVVEGTSAATVTDFDGNFQLSVPGNDAVLVISYVGFLTKNVPVGSQTNFTISLETDVQSLSEVVVVGYGTVKKSDLTGAVGTIDSESLTERNITNPVESLQGLVPGVQVSNSTGRIGDGFNITIRGQNSIGGGGDPLFVVDGVPTDNIDFLNPQDIERMDILKDASSTAIYGSRGSNGVVIVTTRSGAGAKGGLIVSVESFVGVKDVARLPDLMAPQTWWDYHQSAYLATAGTDPNTGTVTAATLADAVGGGGSNSELLRRVAANESFDWYDAVLKTGVQQNTYVNASGRAENGLGYNLGIGYQNETGNIDNEELNKYTLKLGVDHKINEKFTLGTNATVTLINQDQGSDVAMREAFRLNPFLDPYDLDGVTLFPQPGKLVDENGDFIINKTSTYNPILEINNSIDNVRRWNVIGNTYFQYQPVEWLSFKTSLAAGYSHTRRGRSWGALTNTGASNNNLPSARLDQRQNFNYTWDNQFNITKTFDEKHNFNLLGLYSMFSNRNESSFSSSRNMPFDTSFYNIGSGEQSTYDLGSGFNKNTLRSYALRLNYSYDDKYLLTLSNRWDGSSVFPEENRWDSFPSAALGWNISNEDFLAESATVNNLKLRMSFGYTGNNIISPYSSLNTLDSQTYYDYAGSVSNGFVSTQIANAQLKWERTREFNVGVDFGLWRDRITGSVDVYDRLSDDLLFTQDLPSETGFSNINANVASVSNRGVELALTTRNIQTEDVTWTTSLTFTKNTNELKSIYGQSEVDDIGNNLFIGESLDAIYNYKFTGIWQADEVAEAAGYGMQEGQEKLLDVNNDGQYTPDGDRIILGSSNPDWTGSFFSSLRVKNFDLSTSVIITQGVLVYSNFHSNFADTRDRGRQKLDIDWYVPANGAGLPVRASNTYPQPRNEGSFWRNNGVGYYKDASFVKVKNIAIGYNLGGESLEKLGINALRVYANVLNPFVFTDYEGYDPEWAGASLNTGRPSSVTYQLGFNLKF
ncbi:TonB-linked SusC/RagA family outer membrane protein [Leeuwenhoekiella aestuarii]|uniref:TonB-linked SusC/RagA family outer membrane protein n=1 Tax=Leeuwenhoekiella aestuarii TaxID=2249426 RepID=A0A4Q0NXW3_9FLAO|nr:TonB-dependent receptor [Leeuwenhoekiella aestuarii]RXG12465.1 TonB-linked SusC/RagA family outer membrane protein [Leeuwenhoekiella aestuarii]RXG16479.1 TonB-linked SusC/RagA family outer membrane protein [Leeuwenhoekiella aestuarii]